MKAHGLNPRIRKSPFFEATLDYGSDILVSNNPFEMGMGHRVDLDKPDFIGKAAGLFTLTKQIIYGRTGRRN